MAKHRKDKKVKSARVSLVLPSSFSSSLSLTLAFLSYCPILLTLRPGEHLHINKGRIHAFRKVDWYKELNADDCHFEMRKKLQNDLGEGKRDNRCVSLAWDWINKGRTSLGVARELSTSVKAHNRKASSNRSNVDGDGEQILGKVMHFSISLANTLNHELQDTADGDKTKAMELELVRGMIPVIDWAKKRLKKEEDFLPLKHLKDDADEGIGPNDVDLERYECAICFCELWCYYVEAIPKGKNEDTTFVCIECFRSKKQTFKPNKELYRKRMKHLSANRLLDIGASFRKLTQERSCWWQSEITFDAD